jgi:glycosyltransferase involved in cell wall biosynthesis
MTPSARLRLSLVIPVLDDAELLDRCLEAVARQTRLPDEVVVVDNGSTDASANVALRHGARVVDEPVRGIPAAASCGYDAASGDVVLRCDADTVPPEDWVERIGRAFEEDATLDAVTGPGTFYDLPRGRARVARVFYMRGYYWGIHAALAGVPLWGSNMAVRRSTWESVSARVHRDDPRVHDDIDLSFQLPAGTVVRYDRALVVGVSGRTFDSPATLWRRFDWAFRTLALGWRTAPPWTRWARRLAPGRG